MIVIIWGSVVRVSYYYDLVLIQFAKWIILIHTMSPNPFGLATVEMIIVVQEVFKAPVRRLTYDYLAPYFQLPFAFWGLSIF